MGRFRWRPMPQGCLISGVLCAADLPRLSQKQVAQDNEGRHPERSRRVTTVWQGFSHGSTPLTMTSQMSLTKSHINWTSKIKLQIACLSFLRKQESKDLLDSRLRGNDYLCGLYFTFDSNLVSDRAGARVRTATTEYPVAVCFTTIRG